MLERSGFLRVASSRVCAAKAEIRSAIPCIYLLKYPNF